MNPSLKFILFLLIALILGFGIGWISNTKKPNIEVDKHKQENSKYDSALNVINNKLIIQDQQYIDLEKRISIIDSLYSQNNKKGNETKNNFHKSDLSKWNDSLLRANNIK